MLSPFLGPSNLTNEGDFIEEMLSRYNMGALSSRSTRVLPLLVPKHQGLDNHLFKLKECPPLETIACKHYTVPSVQCIQPGIVQHLHLTHGTIQLQHLIPEVNPCHVFVVIQNTVWLRGHCSGTSYIYRGAADAVNCGH